MATREQIFLVLCEASGPMSRQTIEDKVGESYRKFQTQLDRWVEQKLIEDTGEHHYVMTDMGREEALKTTIALETAPLELHKPDFSEESLGTTEYQKFMKFGMTTGIVPMQLIQQTADHVWDGGDFHDLTWVAKAMVEMGIRQDLRGRWFHRWRSYLKAGIPLDMPTGFLPAETGKSEEKTEAEKKPGAGKRDYILDENDYPLKVGLNLGDMDYQDAMDLSKLRTSRRKDPGQAGVGSMADEMTKVFRAVSEFAGARAEGKSYIVKPGEAGYQVDELDTSKPVIIPQPATNKPGPTSYIDSEGAVQELKPGQPLVIVKEAPKTATQGSHFLIDQATGKVTEVTAGQPVVIIRDQATPAQSTPIQVTDKDGKPLVLDLGTFIRLEEHRDKQKRDEESHGTKMEIAKGFKDMLKNLGTALGNVIEKEGE